MHWTYVLGEPNVEAMNTTQGTARRKERSISTSVLVIGTGGSGLRAAIEVAEAGTDVLAVGKRPKEDAHTSLAAGGINAALATVDPEDTRSEERRVGKEGSRRGGA